EMGARVHPFVHDRRGNSRRGDVAPREEGELGHTGTIAREVRASTGKARDNEMMQVAAEVGGAPRLVSIDQVDRVAEPSEDVGGGDVGARVFHEDGKATQ